MPASQPVALTVITANIGRHASQAKARDNVHRIRVRFPHALIGFQEIDEDNEANEHRILGERFGAQGPTDDTFTFVHKEMMVPIAVPEPWTIADTGKKQTCEGRPHVTPARFVITARCRNSEHPDFPPVVFMNGHYPHNAPDLWEKCQAAWVAHVADVHDAGFTIITTRDVNFHPSHEHPRLPALHKMEHQFIDGGLDRITVIPAASGAANAVSVRATGTHVVDLDIDGHNAHAVDLKLTAAPN